MNSPKTQELIDNLHFNLGIVGQVNETGGRGACTKRTIFADQDKVQNENISSDRQKPDSVSN